MPELEFRIVLENWLAMWAWRAVAIILFAGQREMLSHTHNHHSG